MSSWSGNKIHFRERKIPKSYINSIKEIENDVHPSPSRWIIPNYFAVICTIALEEDLYIDEWIEYNKLLGFLHTYIFMIIVLIILLKINNLTL